MEKNQYSDLLLDHTKDLIWVVDRNLLLVYANKAYLNLMKEVTGVEKELNTPILVEGFGEGYIEKWKSYYQRALSGEYFEIREHFYNPETKEMQYGHIVFSPIRDEPGEILTVACRSTDITPGIWQNDHASRLMDASLDVFCTIDEAGKFVFVSAASADHWGYLPEELIGKPYRDLIVEEDVDKTDLVAAEIVAGKEIKSFLNRFRKKNGDIAYNLWSARWDHDSKLMYCLARDAKEKFEEEAEKELLSQISLSFNNEEELIPATNRLCENLYAFGKFDLIELWCPNLDRNQIKLIGHSTQNRDFYEFEPSETSFQKNEGMPGKVWEKDKQLLWDAKQINKYFIRKKGAAHLGLQAILGIPLTFNDELVGVLLIGTRRKPDYLEQQSPVLSRLEKFIGSEINRKRLENDLRNVFDATPEILCITDFGGRFLKINNAGCALLGYTTKEVLFYSLDEFSIKEDKGKFDQIIKGVTKNASVFTFENRFLSKDGQVIWLSWNCNTALEEGLVYASAKNITAEVQLRELNAQAGSLAKIGSWEFNLEKNTVFWSKMVHQLHETNPNSFFPDLETAIDFYREDFRPLVMRITEKSITTGEGFDFEAVIVTKKLQERWVRAIGNVEFVNGKAKRVFGSFQDITDRKESELRLQTLSDDLPGVTFQYVIKPDGQDSMRSVSKASGKIWGLSAEECEKNINQVWEQINKAGDLKEVQQSIQQSIASGEKWHYRWKNVLPNGELRWHEGFGTPNLLPDGTVIFNSMIFDITDEKKSVLLYEETANTARLGTWEVDLISQKVYLSKVTREIHELDEKTEISLEDGLNFYKENYRDMARKAIQNAIENGEPWEFELPIITTKGNERWVRGIGQVEMIDGKSVRLFGSFQDIHDRKIAELRLQSIANDLPGVIFQYHLYPDGTDRLLTVSNGSKHIWGVSPQQCEADINLVWDQIKKGGDYEQVVQDITHSIQTKTQWHSKWRNILPDGTVRWHKGFGTPYFQPDGTIIYNSMVFDYTDEKLAVDLYEEASEIAKIGNWELNLANQDETDNMYWSPMLKQILEVNDDYNPSLTGGFEFYEEESKVLIQNRVERLMESGTPFDLELLIQTAQGNSKWIRCIGKAEFVEGNCVRIFGSFQDIHAAKSYELRVTEILESISDAFYAVDADWNFTYFNREAENLLKKSADEVLGGNIWKIFSPAKGTILEEVYRRVASTGQSESFEYHYPGDGCWYDISTYPSAGGVSVYFDNIDERRKTVQELEKAYKEKNEILESIGDAFFAVDDEWTVTYWNKQAETILGRVKEDIVGKNLWEEYPDAIDTDFYRQYHRAMETGEAINFEEYYLPLDMWIGVTVYPSENGLSIYFKDITLRKEADIRLLEANERFEIITRATNDAIWDYNIDENTLFWGDGFKALFGYEVEKITPTLESWTSHIHPDDLERVKSSVFEAIENKNVTIWQEEYQYEKADGTYAFIFDKGIILRDQDGKAVRMLGAMSDFTQLKNQEKELIENENYLRTILDNEPECVKVLNSKGELLSMNPAGLAMIEADNEQQVLGHRMTDLVNKEYQLGFNQLSKEVFKGNSGSFEFEITGLKGGCRWLETHAVPLKDPTGKIVNLLGVTRDITERKKGEEQILKLKLDAERILNTVSEGIHGVGLDGKIIFENPASAKMFGWETNNLVGRPAHETIHHTHPDGTHHIKEECAIYATLRDGKTRHVADDVFWRKDGSSFPVDFTSSVMRNELDEIIGSIVTFRDITEQKKAERELLAINEKLSIQTKELQRSNEELEQFAFITSHDLQEPLRMISSFMDQLKRKYADQLDDKALQYIYFATDGAKRMKKIILDLLLYSRANRPTEQLEEVNLNEIVSEYTQLRRKLIAEKNASITFDVLPVLQTYRAPITQVIHNLLDNAIKYVKENVPPRIEIHAKEKETLWEFAVKDNGIGIDERFYDKVFIIFQRLHNRSQHDGTGIGLSIAKRSVEFLGGEIWLESTVGEGSAFYFTIPKK